MKFRKVVKTMLKQSQKYISSLQMSGEASSAMAGAMNFTPQGSVVIFFFFFFFFVIVYCLLFIVFFFFCEG